MARELIAKNAAVYQSYQGLQAEGERIEGPGSVTLSPLKADPEVKVAIRELNKGRGPDQGYVLGPVGDLP